MGLGVRIEGAHASLPALHHYPQGMKKGAAQIKNGAFLSLKSQTEGNLIEWSKVSGFFTPPAWEGLGEV
jgi:hypothetical protein